MKKWILGIMLLICRSAFCNQIVTYEPSIFKFSGVLDLQTFPGPPNYESIKEGDEIERHFYLKLNHPINVIPNPKEKNHEFENATVEKNVRIFQLVISADGSAKSESIWKFLRKKGKGKKVEITGSLFHRFTGHHHSRVLLSVNNVQ